MCYAKMVIPPPLHPSHQLILISKYLPPHRVSQKGYKNTLKDIEISPKD